MLLLYVDISFLKKLMLFLGIFFNTMYVFSINPKINLQILNQTTQHNIYNFYFVFTIRKYTFNIGYLEHSTSVLKPMLKVPMLNVSMLTSVLKPNKCTHDERWHRFFSKTDVNMLYKHRFPTITDVNIFH